MQTACYFSSGKITGCAVKCDGRNIQQVVNLETPEVRGSSSQLGDITCSSVMRTKQIQRITFEKKSARVGLWQVMHC